VAVIDLKNVTFCRRDTSILSGVNWSIEPGRHWALLGPNGAGKTTLLKMMTGYEWPSSGTVALNSREFGTFDLRAARKVVGWVSTALEKDLPANDTGLNIVLSGFEASMGLYRNFTPDEQDTALNALKLISCPHLAQRRFAVLSQGERQRLMIARALVINPEILILDEPCAGLDPAARHTFLQDIARLCQKPHSPVLVFVTHHIEEIGPWIHHVHLLKAGRTIAQGPRDQMLTAKHMQNLFDLPCRVLSQNDHYFLIPD
jgi:iron complex transport system ATP-binding protein